MKPDPRGELDWIISEDETLKKVQFNYIFPNKEHIDSITMLFDTNSYIINVRQRFFIINGGRRIQPKPVMLMDEVWPLAVKRRRKTVTLNGEESGDESLSYLLGIEGILNGEKREVLIQISQDGSLWAWKSKR